MIIQLPNHRLLSKGERFFQPSSHDRVVRAKISQNLIQEALSGITPETRLKAKELLVKGFAAIWKPDGSYRLAVN